MRSVAVAWAEDAASRVSTEEFAGYLAGGIRQQHLGTLAGGGENFYIVSQCIATTEPAYLAKHAFQLAQLFSTFYHRYPILTETDEGRKKFLLATAAVVRRELIRVLGGHGDHRAAGNVRRVLARTRATYPAARLTRQDANWISQTV